MIHYVYEILIVYTSSTLQFCQWRLNKDEKKKDIFHFTVSQGTKDIWYTTKDCCDHIKNHDA